MCFVWDLLIVFQMIFLCQKYYRHIFDFLHIIIDFHPTRLKIEVIHFL